MADELKVCPFCKGKLNIDVSVGIGDEHTGYETISIDCQNKSGDCPLACNEYDSMKEATKAANRRTP